MTQSNKRILLTIAVMFIIMILPILASAQLDETPGSPEEQVPIDGGLSLLVAAGVGYGAKKMKDRKARIINIKN
jgi:hypothetical protein